MQQTSLPLTISSQPTSQILRRDVILRKSALLPHATALHALIRNILKQAPLRHMMTPMGHAMSVGMSNCGAYGWTSSKQGYRYTQTDPISDKPWPAMPSLFVQLAQAHIQKTPWPSFTPNACLINAYRNNAHMGLHQDRDEGDLTQPIVSFSLGMSAVFVLGKTQDDPHQRSILLEHGDILIWGGGARLMKHGIRRLTSNPPAPPEYEGTRFNLTLRCVR